MSNSPQWTYTDNGIAPLMPGHQSFASVNLRSGLPNYGAIDTFLAEKGIQPTPNARYSIQRAIVYRFMRREEELTVDEERSYLAAIVDIGMMWAVVSEYRGRHKLPKNLRSAFFRDPVQMVAGAPSRGRDTLAEFYAGARFKAAGCEISWEEPDVVCTFESLKFGLAVKRFKVGEGNLEEHIRKARNQIERRNLPGIIVLDVTQSSPFLEVPHRGTQDELRAVADEWKQEHFYRPMHRRAAEWGIDQRRIPYVLCFLHYAGFLPDGRVIRTTLMSNLGTGALAVPSERERAMIQSVHRVVQQVRATLPEAAK